MFRLALALGRTVGEVGEMPVSEFREWMAFSTLEPFGGPADDFRGALGAAVTLNCNRKKGSKAITPFDLLPWHAEGNKARAQAQSSAAIRAMFNNAAKASARAAKKKAKG